MEIETLHKSYLNTTEKNSYNSALAPFDLPALIYSMKQSNSWAQGELNAMVLLKNPLKQIILTAMHAWTEIKSFQANESISLQILEGELMFNSRSESVTLKQGQLLTFYKNRKYRLTSSEETVFLLTISEGSGEEAKN
jgi:quercetin dioxygenase-like cupin family protein